MNYNFDETETKKLKENLAKIQKSVEESVINSDYKKA